MADQNNEEGAELPIATQPGQTLSPTATANTPVPTAPAAPTDQPLPVPQAQDGTYHVMVSGRLVRFGSPPTLDAITHVGGTMPTDDQNGQMGGATDMQVPAGTDPNDWSAQVDTALKNSLARSGANIAKGAMDFGNMVDSALHSRTPEEQATWDKSLADTSSWYNKIVNDHPETAPTSIGDIHSALDAAKMAASTVGGLTPYFAGGAIGGTPALLAVGGLSGAGQADAESHGDPGAEALGGALGAGTAVLPLPFMKGDAPLLQRLARGALGGATTGAAVGAGNDVVSNYSQGRPLTAINPSDVLNNAVIGSVLGAGGAGLGVGGVGHSDAPAPEVQSPVDVTSTDKAGVQTAQARADSALADRISQLAGGNRVTASTSNNLLDSAHTQIAEEIKGVRANLGDILSPTAADSLDDVIDRAGANATLRDAQNKVKGSPTEDDIQQLLNRPTGENPGETLGDTAEGRTLADLIRQSNSLTSLARGNQLGGLARYTSIVNPLSDLLPGGNRSPSDVLKGLGGNIARGAVGELVLPGVGGLAGPFGADVAARLAGRVGDATGLWAGNSRLNNFLRNNAGQTAPIDMSGARSLVNDRVATQAQEVQAAQAQQLAQAKAAQDAADRAQMLRQQNMLNNTPGVNGFDRSIYDQTGLLPRQTTAGMFELNRQGAVTPDEFNAFFKNPKALMANNVGNRVIDQLDGLARQGTIERDPEWLKRQAVTPNPASAPAINPFQSMSYAAAARGNQDRVTGAMDRVASNDALAPTDQRRVNTGLASIGRTNNRADAAQVLNQLTQSLSGEAQKTAMAEGLPLVRQIRHATATDAAKARLNDTAIAKQGATKIATNGAMPHTMRTLFGDRYDDFRKIFGEERQHYADSSDALVASFHRLTDLISNSQDISGGHGG
jgi:hypothetical protein